MMTKDDKILQETYGKISIGFGKEFNVGDIVKRITSGDAPIGVGYQGKLGHKEVGGLYKISKIEPDSVELIPQDPIDGSFEYRGWILTVRDNFKKNFVKATE